MQSTTIPTDVRSTSIPPPGVETEARASATRRTLALDAAGRAGGASAAGVLPWLSDAAASSPVAWLASAPAAGPGRAAGYATLAATKTASSAAKAPAPPKITGEWSFLTDASLTVEEKLARFMQAVQKKLDDELTSKMEEYKAKYGEGGTEAKKSDGGGILGGILKALFPPLAAVDAIFGGVDEFLVDALKTLGGPLLAALATAVGLPALAPAALKLGEGIVAMAGGSTAPATKKVPVPSKGTVKEVPVKSPSATAKEKTTTTTKSSGSSQAKGEAGSPDERLAMLEIQRLVDKQNQLFTLVSNVMKNVHDTGMVAVQNLR